MSESLPRADDFGPKLRFDSRDMQEYEIVANAAAASVLVYDKENADPVLNHTLNKDDAKSGRVGSNAFLIVPSMTKKEVYVAIRGTVVNDKKTGLDDVFTNLDTSMDLTKDGKTTWNGTVHAGYWKRASETASGGMPMSFIKKQFLDRGYRVVFTGHSLGGAVASCMTATLLGSYPKLAPRVRCITFGSPFWCDDEFTAALADHLSPTNDTVASVFHVVIHDKDVVPYILSKSYAAAWASKGIKSYTDNVFTVWDGVNSLAITLPVVGKLKVLAGAASASSSVYAKLKGLWNGANLVKKMSDGSYATPLERILEFVADKASPIPLSATGSYYLMKGRSIGTAEIGKLPTPEDVKDLTVNHHKMTSYYGHIGSLPGRQDWSSSLPRLKDHEFLAPLETGLTISWGLAMLANPDEISKSQDPQRDDESNYKATALEFRFKGDMAGIVSSVDKVMGQHVGPEAQNRNLSRDSDGNVTVIIQCSVSSILFVSDGTQVGILVTDVLRRKDSILLDSKLRDKELLGDGGDPFTAMTWYFLEAAYLRGLLHMWKRKDYFHGQGLSMADVLADQELKKKLLGMDGGDMVLALAEVEHAIRNYAGVLTKGSSATDPFRSGRAITNNLILNASRSTPAFVELAKGATRDSGHRGSESELTKMCHVLVMSWKWSVKPVGHENGFDAFIDAMMSVLRSIGSAFSWTRLRRGRGSDKAQKTVKERGNYMDTLSYVASNMGMDPGAFYVDEAELEEEVFAKAFPDCTLIEFPADGFRGTEKLFLQKFPDRVERSVQFCEAADSKLVISQALAWLDIAARLARLRKVLNSVRCVGVVGVTGSGKTQLIKDWQGIPYDTSDQKTAIPKMYRSTVELETGPPHVLDIVDYPGLDDDNDQAQETGSLFGRSMPHVFVVLLRWNKEHSTKLFDALNDYLYARDVVDNQTDVKSMKRLVFGLTWCDNMPVEEICKEGIDERKRVWLKRVKKAVCSPRPDFITLDNIFFVGKADLNETYLSNEADIAKTLESCDESEVAEFQKMRVENENEKNALSKRMKDAGIHTPEEFLKAVTRITIKY